MLEHLPPGFTSRPANPGDVEAVTELMRAVDIALTGKSDICVEDTRSDWKTGSFDLAADTVVVVAPGEDAAGGARLVGYAELWNRSQHEHLSGDGYVHPDFLGLGIGTALLRRVESRAREHIPLAAPGARVFIRSGLYGHDQPAICLFEQEGYAPVRYFWRMQIDLEAPPPPPELPQGLQLRRAESGLEARVFFETMHAAFQDHWGFNPWEYADWCMHHMDYPGFDPSLWYLVEDGAQAVAVAMCRDRDDLGWISTLGVLPSWRRRGLGLALLRQAFGDFFRRGTPHVALTVDAANPTGAIHLYEGAGMRVVEKYIAYEKELRPGEEDSL